MKYSKTPPEVNTYSLDEFFTKFYTVPAYQRNYSWTASEVSELMNDLLDYFDDSKAPYYLLGDVIVVDTKASDGYDFEVIDGQQRLTTLVLLFASIFRRLEASNFDQDDLILVKSLVFWTKKVRVKMSGNGSEAALAFLNGAKISELPKTTPTQKAISEALVTIDEKLTERFGEQKPGSLHDFFMMLQESVYLSRLRLIDREAAYEFFERVNDRGRPLSKTDLLKNRLLQKIRSDEDFDNASEVWSGAEKALLPFGREGSMPFLLKSILIADENRKVKESDLYKDWKPFVEDDASCLKLVDRIEVKSGQLANILGGKTPKGEQDLSSTGTSFLRFTQNHAVKLAGGSLPQHALDSLSKRLEARALLSLFSLERSQTYEQLVVGWSHEVQELGNQGTADHILEAIHISKSEIEELLERCKLSILNLRYGKTPGQTSRIRYLLAVANHELHSMTPKFHYTLENLLETTKKARGKEHPGYDIEHIGAASTNQNTLGDLVDSIGNLTLFHSKDNRSAGNTAVEFKAEDYRNSICFATKTLSAIPDSDASIEAVIEPFRKSTVDDGTWTQKDVETRALFYWGLFETKIRRDLLPSPARIKSD